MKSSVLCFILFYTINCEWVEITPIVNKKPIVEVKQTSRTTTPASYEVFVKTPILKSEYLSTTPAYNNWTKYGSEKANDIVTSTFSNDPISTTELNTPSTTTEEFSTSSGLEYEEEEFEKVPEENNGVAYEGFLPFLKMVQNNLLNYKHKTRSSKMSILKHLRDHLLTNIKQRIMNLWNQPKTEARGYKDDNHMDFPSNEGALMTIGFLTFAVFLIKLVIKLVHALKSKQQYYAMTTTTTAPSVVFLKRKKRDEDHQEAAKILQYIEEF